MPVAANGWYPAGQGDHQYQANLANQVRDMLRELRRLRLRRRTGPASASPGSEISLLKFQG
jgi:hypothetical protein